MAYDLYVERLLKIGQIAQFIFYLQTLIFQFFMMSFVIGNLLGVSGVNVHLNAILEEKITILNTNGDIIKEEDGISGELSLENVSFAYPEKPDVMALKDVSFSVDNDKKRVIALVGSSGCGKSSCVAMLQQFYLPCEGRVLFNGRDIRTLNSKWYHS